MLILFRVVTSFVISFLLLNAAQKSAAFGGRRDQIMGDLKGGQSRKNTYRQDDATKEPYHREIEIILGGMLRRADKIGDQPPVLKVR